MQFDMEKALNRVQKPAAQSANNQYNIIKAKKHGKIVSEELVDVIFEGTEIKAKKQFTTLKELHHY